MISKVVVVVTLFSVAFAGQEAPPAKAHSYNVPSVAKVSYPAPTVTKSVETYSAPSIEKTTTITRTITSPLNAPAVKSVQYSAPAAPLIQQQGPLTYATTGGFANSPAVGYAYAPTGYAQAPIGYAQAPIGYTQAPTGYAQAPIGYAQAPIGYTQAPTGYAQAPIGYAQASIGYAQTPIGYTQAPTGYAQVPIGYAQAQVQLQPTPIANVKKSVQTLALNVPGLSYAAQPQLSTYSQGISGATTTYAAPYLGYSFGGGAGHAGYATAPVYSSKRHAYAH